MSEFSTPRPPPKMMPRPRVAVTGPRPGSSFGPRSAAPLQNHNDNVPQTPDSPQSVLSPVQGQVKIKVKSATTPEARSRVLLKSRTPMATPRPRPLITDDSNWVGSSSASVGHQDLLDSMDPAPALAASETVLVSVRVRPHNEAELRADTSSAWVTSPYNDQLIKLAKGRDGNRDDREWFYDRILDPEVDNAKVYNTSARAHVRSAMEGYNAVIFAYGQTASGKTFTLTGSPNNPGIIPLAVSDLFAQIRSTPDREFLLRASYLELYNETIIDLLSPEVGKELTLSEGRKKGDIVIQGLTENAVRTEDEVRKFLRVGEDRRKVGGTDWNQRSSRSHCVFRIVIESRAVADGTRTPGRDKATRISSLSIIDLAGSEKHTSSKERNAEGKHINQSLLTLKLVISKLADMASKRAVMHIPYRDSKLTRLLQPSLSGDALISVICTISPSPVNMAESISTLSFASGLKRVMLSAQRKEVMDPEALIQQYQNEIAELRAQLRDKELHPSAKLPKPEKDMEARMRELMSLILTSSSVENNVGTDSPIARPLSPSKLSHQAIDMNKTEASLREQLHEETRQRQVLEQEVVDLKAELEVRPKDRDEQCLLLQNEVGQLRMIANDYERHLREPSQKLREDVRREFANKIQKLENQLESKTIWADNLHNQLHTMSQEKKVLQARAADSEKRLNSVFQWIQMFMDDGEGSPPLLPELPTPAKSLAHSVMSNGSNGSNGSNTSDFGPVAPTAAERTLLKATFNTSRMRRGHGSVDLQSQFQDWYQGSLARPPRGQLLADQEAPALARVDYDDDEF